ncbi:MAG: HRDC domain-containing protein [Bacteroides sp.]|nr:HRDC domain-containing protein [Bacteroides sp.]
MQFKIFNVPVLDPEPAMEEMNKFFRTNNKVLSVHREFVQGEQGLFWSFCVEYIDNGGFTLAFAKKETDYKEVLDGKTFAVFSRLRNVRKKIAQEDGTPVYSVCKNEELAEMAKLPDLTVANLRKVKGFGEKKIERYAARLQSYFAMLDDLCLPAERPQEEGEWRSMPEQGCPF